MSVRRFLAVAGTALAVTILGWGVAGLVRGQPGVAVDIYRGSEPPETFQLVEFALRDERGRLVRSRDLRGKVVVLTFLDSQCDETCPIVAGLVADGLERIPAELARSVAAVAISTDPDGDTAAARRTFLRRHGADGRIRYASGSLPTLEPIWKGFQILSSHESGDDEVHSAPVRIYDTAGVWVSTLHAGVDLTPANLAHDIREALRAGRSST